MWVPVGGDKACDPASPRAEATSGGRWICDESLTLGPVPKPAGDGSNQRLCSDAYPHLLPLVRLAL